jgi:hypothetical protein
MSAALAHNILFVRQTYNHDLALRKEKSSIYREAWNLIDELVHETSRTIQLYPYDLDARHDKQLEVMAALSLDASSVLRKHRPFYLDEKFYKKAIKLTTMCSHERENLLNVIRHKKGDLDNYNLWDAEKEAHGQWKEIKGLYEELNADMRKLLI